MKTLTLNGDWAIATAAFAQFYDSFVWDNDTALTAFDFGIEQTLFENLEGEFGAHVFISSNQVTWSDGTATITLSTDATLSADDTQRTAQITNLSAQNDTLRLSYSSAGQADVDLIWTPTSLTLTSGGQTAEWAHAGNIKFADLSDIARAIANFGTFAEGFEEDQLHAINTAIDLELGTLRFLDQNETIYAFQVVEDSITVTSQGYSITLDGEFTAEDAAMFITDITTSVEDISELGILFDNDQIEEITIRDASGAMVLQVRPVPENSENAETPTVTLHGTNATDNPQIEVELINNLNAESFAADLGAGDDQLTFNVYCQFDQVYFDYIYDPVANNWSYGLAEDQDIQMPQSNIDGGLGYDTLYIEHAYTSDQTYDPKDFRGPVEVNFNDGVVVGHGLYTTQETFEIFRVGFENIEQVQTDWLGDLTVTGSSENDEFAPVFTTELGKFELGFNGGDGQDTLDLSHLINANAHETMDSEWSYRIAASDWQDLNWRWSVDGDWTVISIGTDALFRLKSVENIRFNDDVEYRLADYLNMIPNASSRVGTIHDDSIVGSAGGDEIFALSGKDTIQSLDGNDTIHAGYGDDIISAGAGDDSIDGSTGHDHITADQGNDTVTGGSGYDTITGGTGADIVNGGDGDDTLTGGDGSDTLIGGAGADILNGGAGNDQLSDIDGGGTLSGEAGDDTIQLFDTLINDTTITGGAGQDRLELLHLDYKSNYDNDSDYWDVVKTDAGYTLNIGTTHDDISRSITISGIEQIAFSGKDIDTIENVHLWMNTERGDVFRLGQLEQNTVETINMGGGNNYAEVTKGTITLTGGSGDDTVRVGSAGENETAPNATLNLGNGNNTVTLYAGQADITTGAGADDIRVLQDDGQVSAWTGQGDDYIETMAGNDTIQTGAGNDTVSSGTGDDIITNIQGNDQIFTGTGQDRVTSYSGNTLIDDRADDGVQNSVVLDDILITRFGVDTVYAGSGNDVIVTDLPGSIYYSADHLTGMKGDDILFGGRGADTFVFRAGDGNDTIGAIDMDDLTTATRAEDIAFIASDFTTGVDKIHLQFGANFAGAQLSDVIAENADWFWSETETGLTLSTSDGSLHFWGLSPAQISDTDFEFVG